MYIKEKKKERIGRMLRSGKPERREMEALSVNIETFISGGYARSVSR